MNDSFSSERMLQVLTDDLRVNGGRYLKFMLSGLGITAVLMLWPCFTIRDFNNFYPQDSISLYATFFFWAMSMMAGGDFFKELSTKGGRINMLMQPATQLEKYVARWLLIVPGFLIAFFAGIELIDVARHIILNVRFGDVRLPYYLHSAFFERELGYVYIGLLTLQSYFILGSSIWPKRSIANTIVALLVIGIALCIYCSILYSALIHGWVQPPFNGNVYTLLLIPSLVSLAINYTLAYFRFKEIELIQRW